MTAQRRVILQVFRETESHLTADEVFRRVRHILPRVSLGTIYRNLELLARCGFIGKMEAAGGRKRFDGNPTNHYHVRCEQCGKVEDAPVEVMQSIEAALQEKSQYKILGHRVEFIGLCPACKVCPAS